MGTYCQAGRHCSFQSYSWIGLLISFPSLAYIALPVSKKASQQGDVYKTADFFMALIDILSVGCPLLSVLPSYPLSHLNLPPPLSPFVSPYHESFLVSM